MTNQEKVERIATLVQEHIGADHYKLLGLKTKKVVFPRGTINITRAKGEETSSIKSLEQLTRGQIGYFQNLNNPTNVDNLNSVEFINLIDDEIEGNKMIILVNQTKDSLGRIVVEKQGVIIRKYTDEEEKEYQARASQDEAAGMGYTSAEDLLKSFADGKF